MSASILAHFKRTVADYDTVADKVVLENDALHERLVGALPFEKNDSFKVIDLGCGTGHGMNLVLSRFPRAKITGIDFSDRMIALASKNLSKHAERLQLLEQDFTEHRFQDPVDAVISAVAIHNITHEEKRELFRHIASILKPGGVFINGDFFEAESSEENTQMRARYVEYLRLHLSGDELETWITHAMDDDMPMKLSTQDSLLQEAGFTQMQVIWQCNNEAVYVVRKR